MEIPVSTTAIVEPSPMGEIDLTREPVSAPVKEQDVENFLDPLVFNWTEDKFIVSEAIRNYVAEFDAEY